MYLSPACMKYYTCRTLNILSLLIYLGYLCPHWWPTTKLHTNLMMKFCTRQTLVRKWLTFTRYLSFSMEQIEIEIWNTATTTTAAVNDKLAQPLIFCLSHSCKRWLPWDRNIVSLSRLPLVKNVLIQQWVTECVCSVFQQQYSQSQPS